MSLIGFIPKQTNYAKLLQSIIDLQLQFTDFVFNHDLNSNINNDDIFDGLNLVSDSGTGSVSISKLSKEDDGVYVELDGVNDYTESEETTSKSWIFNYKNIASASDLSLAEIVSDDGNERVSNNDFEKSP